MDTSVTPTRIAMNMGAVTAALMLVVLVFGLQILGWLVFVGGIYYGMSRFRKEAGGSISYIKALYAGIQTAFFTSVILAFAGYMTTTLDTSLIVAMLDAVEQQLLASEVPSGLVETAMQQWRGVFSPVIFAIMIVFAYSATGVFAGMICALFVWKEPSRRLVGEF